MSDIAWQLNLIIKLIKDGNGTKEATQDLERLDAEQKKVAISARAVVDSFRQVASSIGLGFGLQQGIQFLKQSVELFLEEEKVLGRLEGALRAQGNLTKENLEILKDFAQMRGNLTGFDDGGILTAAGTLATFGTSMNDMQGVLDLTMDLAAGLGTDLPQAAMLMGRTLQGEFSALGRYGIQIDETKSKSEQLQEALRQLQDRFGGIAEQQGQKAGAQLNMIKNTFEDLRKVVGKFVIEELTPMMKLLNEIGSSEALKKSGVNDEGLLKTLIPGFGPLNLVNNLLRLRDEAATPNRRSQLGRALPGNYRPPDSEAGGAGGGIAQDAIRGASIESQINALEDLRRIEKEIRNDALTGFARERAAAEEYYSKRRTELEAIAKEGFDVSNQLIEADEVRLSRLVEINRRETAEFTEKEKKKIEEARRTAEEIEAIRAELDLAAVSGYDRQILAVRKNYDSVLEQIEGLKISAGEREELNALALQGYEQQTAAIQEMIEKQKEAAFWASDMGQIIQGSAQIIGSSFSSAFIDLVSGTEKVGEALKKFFGTTLAGIGQMITQMMIFNSITGLFRAGSAATMADAGFRVPNMPAVPLAALGGFFPRMMAAGGMQFADRATFLPDFNVIAGEAGRELLTVLARPRMMQIGGMQAAVGEMEGCQMAVVPTSAMGGGGGQSVLIVRMEPGLKGELIQQGGELGVRLVTEDMGRMTPVREAVRSAAGT